MRERMGDSDLFARRAERDAALPVEPMRAADDTEVSPRRHLVETPHQLEQPVLGRVEVTAECRDLVRERAELLVIESSVHGSHSQTVSMYSNQESDKKPANLLVDPNTAASDRVEHLARTSATRATRISRDLPAPQLQR